jgi:hypothetical protein
MRLSRSTGALSGLLIMLLGLWGALIPFVGPYFDYSFGSNSTWHYTSDRLWLCILPGAVAFVGGFLLLVAVTRALAVLGGWLVMVAGAWFVVGPSVSLTWENGAGPIGRPLFGTTRQMLELLGYFYGLGALLVALAGIALGRFALRPRLVAEPAPAARTAPAVAASPVGAASPTRYGAPDTGASPTAYPGAGASPVADADPRERAPAQTRRRSPFRRKREMHEADRARAVEGDRAEV